MNRLCRILACGALLLCGAALSGTAPFYHVVKTITLGGEGRWDYVAFDAPSHRLFIARETRVMVVDPDTGKMIGEIAGLNGAHGVALANEIGHGFATSGRDGSVTM